MYDIKDIAAACGGKIVNYQPLNIVRLLTDSRRLFVAEESLFIALRGVRHDGAQYISDLYQRGIRAFVCSAQTDVSAYPDATFVMVEDALAALAQIAAMHRRRCASRVVAIVGSNGKTIVKEWLSQIIAGDVLTVRSPRSYNSQVGVPLSLWNIESDTELSIIEAGISQCGEMQKLEAIIAPDDVIVTNIGPAHQENFSSVEEKLSEKLSICKHAKRIFYCKGQTLVAQMIEAGFAQAEKISWSEKHGADFCVNQRYEAGEAVITLTHDNEKYEIRTQLTDSASVENIVHAAVFASVLGIATSNIQVRAASLRHIAMRLEQKEGHNNCTIIDDAYNADIASIATALDMLHVLGDRKGLSRTIILSDLEQTGLPDSEVYARVGELLREKNVKRLIGIGSHISSQLGGTVGAAFFATTDEFLSQMSTADFCNEAILLKGSRSFGFERIAERLEQKRIRTAMEINLDALAHNIAFYRSKLRPETKLLAMVKAYSYGTGSFEIAKLMQAQGVDYLGVAFADEGCELRTAGISLPIIVMNPEEHSYDLMLEYGLEPQIFSVADIVNYSAAAKRMGIAQAGIHIKINTGMNRSGFNPSDIPQVSETLMVCPNVKVVSAFSHLAGSDEECFDDFTNRQISDFKLACADLKTRIGYSFIRHILNSAGIERFSQDQCEMVRLGIGLYGFGFTAEAHRELRNVCTLKSYVSQIRHVAANESVGYSRKTICSRPTTLAIVPIGYADGIDRRLSNGVGEVLIRGQKAPIAGNVCMDICMVDITDVPAVQIADEVVLFGDENPVWQMSDKIGTIPYEVLTGVGRRVKRVYYVE